MRPTFGSLEPCQEQRCLRSPFFLFFFSFFFRIFAFRGISRLLLRPCRLLRCGRLMIMWIVGSTMQRRPGSVVARQL